MPSVGRRFGRQYVVDWDREVGRYHVTLGKESIGFHKTAEGASTLAREHAQRIAVSKQAQPYTVRFVEGAEDAATD